MIEVKDFKLPKWPFFMGDAFMVGAAYFVYWQGNGPLTEWEVIAICVCAILGATAGILPFLLEYRGLLRLSGISTLGFVTDKIQNLEKVAAQISNATNQWENNQHHADKTAATARQIADKMAEELKEFTEFQKKMNDTEKSTLRLEVDKLRRAENESVNATIRLLDHVFALYCGAERSGQANLVNQISNFQNACRESVRRIGLIPFTAILGEPFDAQKHTWADGEKPVIGSVVSETVATGFTYQGKLIRPPLVRLKESEKPEANDKDQTQLPLETETATATAPVAE